MTRKIGLGILMAMMASTAFARNDDNRGNDDRGNRKQSEKQHVTAPEIDPASAMAGLTLMVSGLAVLRGRRKIK